MRKPASCQGMALFRVGRRKNMFPSFMLILLISLAGVSIGYGQTCGDGTCDPGEEGWCVDCSPQGQTCGDGICDPGEEDWCADCPPPGQTCGDGTCDPGEEDWCTDCPPLGPICGDGSCDAGEESTCVADCDIDGDGVADGIDGCPNDPDKWELGICGCGVSDLDTDLDGSPDCIDTDADGDGMPDAWEVMYGLNPLVDDSDADRDSDGYSNITEYRDGTDPENPADFEVLSGAFFVDAAAGDDSYGGRSWGYAKKTIQAAVNACSGVEPETIHVKAGTYLETVILKSRIALFGGYPVSLTGVELGGRDPATQETRIDANRGPNCIVIGAGSQSVAVEGFILSGSTWEAFYGEDAVADLTFRQNRITGCDDGVMVFDGTVSNVTIDGNVFTGNVYGSGVAFWWQADGIDISNNFIQEAPGSNIWGGIEFDGTASNITVTNNVLTGLGGSSTGWTGITFWGGASDFTITGNRVSDMSDSGAYGIHFGDISSRGAIDNNTLTNLQGGINGIQFWEWAAEISINGNTLSAMTGTCNGIHFWYSTSDVSVTNNILQDMDYESGIVLWDTTQRVTVSGNTLENIRGADAYIGFWGQTDDTVISGNLLRNFGDDTANGKSLRYAGIHLFYPANNVQILENTLQDFYSGESTVETFLGISVRDNNTDVRIEGNLLANLSGNGGDGLGFPYRVTSTPPNPLPTATRAVAHNNRLYSVSSAGSGGLLFEHAGTESRVSNNIVSASAEGIHSTGTDTLFANNTLRANRVGMYEEGTGNSFRSNIVSGSESFGIQAANPQSSSVFTYNNIFGNTTNYNGIDDLTGSYGNISQDPIFVSPDGPDEIPGTPDDDLRLAPFSPCIDGADGTGATWPDADGNPPYDDPLVLNRGLGALTYYDMGAFEYQGCGSPDCDQDGMEDVWEFAHFGDGSHDGTGDGDADGLADLAEYQNGTNPSVADTDGDGYPDGQEVADGSDPLDPLSFILPPGSPPQFLTPSPQGRDLRGMVHRKYRFTVKATASEGRCTGLTFSLHDPPEGMEMVHFLDPEDGCEKGRVEFLPQLVGDYTVDISVSDGQRSTAFGPYTVTVAEELLLTPETPEIQVFLRKKIDASIHELTQDFTISGGTPIAGEVAHYLVKVLTDPEEAGQEAGIDPDTHQYRYRFETADGPDGGNRPDGVYYLEVTDAWGFQTVSKRIAIRTIELLQIASTDEPIGVTGGRLEVTSGEHAGFLIEVPSEAVGEPVNLSFSMAQEGVPLISQNEQKGLAIFLEATDLAGNEVVFTSPVNVCIPVPPGEDPNNLALIHFNEQMGIWEQIQARAAEGKLCFSTLGFSLFAMATPSLFECPVAGGATQKHYRMISIPGQVLSRNICDHLQAVYGGFDITRWRLYAYDPVSGRYVEATAENYDRFGEDFALFPGRGFWLISRSDASIPVEGLSIDAEAGTEVTVVLKPGWNMVSNPWTETVNLINRRIEVSSDRSTWVEVNDAENHLTGKVLWKFKGLAATAGSWYEQVALNVAGQGLEPYRSYWIKNITDGPVFFRIMVPLEMGLDQVSVQSGEMSNAGIEDREAPPAPPGDSAEIRQETVQTATTAAAASGGGCFIETAAVGGRGGALLLCAMLGGLIIGLYSAIKTRRHEEGR